MEIIGDGLLVMSLKSLIHVTTKPGASVTFKKGSTTMATKTANSSGVAELEVLSGDWGSWTITSTSSVATNSSTITVNAVTTYNVSLPLTLWLIKDGNFVSGVTRDFASENSGSGSFNDAGDYVLLHQTANRPDHWDTITGYLYPAVTLDGYWKTLYVETSEKGYCNTGECPIAGITSNSGATSDFTSQVQLRSGSGASRYQKSFNSRHTSSLNVSGARGTYKVAFRASMFSYYDGYQALQSADGEIQIWNAYLSP